MNAKTTILACVLNLNKKKRGSREISPAGGRFKSTSPAIKAYECTSQTDSEIIQPMKKREVGRETVETFPPRMRFDPHSPYWVFLDECFRSKDVGRCTLIAGADTQDLNCPLFVMALRSRCLNDLNGEQVVEYPEVITRLPEADIQVKGIRAWVLQGERHQLVFFEMEPSAQVPEHCHPYVQWGIMIKGKMELTINGETRVCEKGDEYTIPAQAKHSAKFLKKCRVMDFFSEKNRYRTK